MLNKGGKLRSGVERNISNNSIDLYLIIEAHNKQDNRAIATEFILETVQEGEMYSPIVQFTLEEAQQLMDELWRVGVKPTNGAGSNATFDAIHAHLVDLQRLVFKDK